MLVKHLRELVGSLGRLRQEILLFAKLAIFLGSNECIGNLSERALNSLLVRQHRFLPVRAGEPESRAKCPALEDGLTHAEGSVPGLRGLADKLVQRVALQAAQAGEG